MVAMELAPVGVIEEGEKEQVAPVASPEHERATVPLKPSSAVSVIVSVPLEPLGTSSMDDAAAIWKSVLVSAKVRDYPDFLTEGERAAQEANDPVMEGVMASARAGYAHGGDRGLLNALYAKQREYYREGKLHAVMLAATCVLMAKKQEALAILEDAYNQHDVEFLAMPSRPDLLTLKDEPRYQALARKIGDLERSSPSQVQRLAAMRLVER
jgi:hypothetical protein